MFYTSHRTSEELDQQKHTGSWGEASLSRGSDHTMESSDRPAVRVQPKGIGPVTDIHENDVLCGRGGRINGHYGNIQFRRFCGTKRPDYFKKGVKKIEKAHIAASVVESIRSLCPPGRFLKQESDGWYDIGCEKAMTKVGQAIREHTSKDDPNDQTTVLSKNMKSEGASELFFAGPLYPGYQPFEMEPVVSQNAIARGQEHGEGLNCLHPSKMVFPERRLSALSTMSGFSALSSLMRESVQSDLSDSVSLACRQEVASEQRRLSIFSDISESMSMLTMADDCFRSSTTTGMEEDTLMDTGHIHPKYDPKFSSNAQNTIPLGHTRKLRMVSDTSNTKALRSHQKQQARRGSIWSMSMTSVLSFRSIGSHTSSVSFA